MRPFLVALLWVVAVGFLPGCGGSSTAAQEPQTPKTPEEIARAQRQKELEALEKQEPKAPYVLDRTTSYHAPHDCGQGPFRIEAQALGSNYGETVNVYACSPRNLAGRARVTAARDEKVTTNDEGYSFGWGKPENERCRASDAEVAHVADAGASSSTTSSKPAASSHAAAPAAKKVDQSEHLVENGSTQLEAGKCPGGLSYQYVAAMEYTTGSGVAVEGKLHIDIWSAEPNDLRDVVFVLQQFRMDPKMTSGAWAKLRDDREAWYAKYAAFAKSHDDMFVHEDAGASFTPPPPSMAEIEPPKPSVHAEWIPGYYHRNGDAWAWVPGWWRVPEADVQAKLTTVAPVAPPPPRDESKQQAEVAVRPAPNAVWTAGHWQWDGARWVWVTGAWRLPPQQGSIWQTPTWRPEARGFVFVPGGWSLRMH